MLERLHPVPAVAREQLVTAVARQRDGNVLTRRHGDEVRGDGRRVGERLVEVPDEPLDQLRRRRRHDPWVVLAADVTRHHGRVGQLAVAVVEADRGRDHRAVQEPGHGGDDRARIHAAAQEGAERHVAPQPDLDGLGQELVEAFGRVGPGLRLGQREVPVPVDAGALGGADQGVTGRQLSHVPEDRGGRRNVEQAGVTVQRLEVDVPLHGGVLEQGLELGGEHEGPPRAQRIIERLLAQSIAGQEQRPRPLVPDGEPEHPAQGLHTVAAEVLVQVHDDFRVGGRLESVPARDQLVSQLDVVVEGLVTGAQVDDGEPAHGHSERSVDVETLVVGPAVDHGAGHALEEPPIHRRSVETVFSGDAAHGQATPRGCGAGARLQSRVPAATTPRTKSRSPDVATMKWARVMLSCTPMRRSA